MKLSHAVIALACVAASAQPVAAQEFDPVVLDPSSDWTLDYGDEYCALFRTFGSGEDQLRFQLTNYGDRVSSQAMVLGGQVPHSRSAAGELAIRLGTNPGFHSSGAVMGDADGQAAASFFIKFYPQDYLDYLVAYAESADDDAPSPQQRPPDPAFEQSMRSLDLDFGDQEITLKTGSMGPPLQALRDCRDNLLETWGLDPEVQANLSRLPQIERSAVRRIASRYPSRAVRNSQRAFVPVRVIVEADGEPRSCTVQLPTPDPAFDEAVCRGLQSRFEPALDAHGDPAVSLFTASVYYFLSS